MFTGLFERVWSFLLLSWLLVSGCRAADRLGLELYCFVPAGGESKRPKVFSLKKKASDGSYKFRRVDLNKRLISNSKVSHNRKMDHLRQLRQAIASTIIAGLIQENGMRPSNQDCTVALGFSRGNEILRVWFSFPYPVIAASGWRLGRSSLPSNEFGPKRARRLKVTSSDVVQELLNVLTGKRPALEKPDGRYADSVDVEIDGSSSRGSVDRDSDDLSQTSSGKSSDSESVSAYGRDRVPVKSEARAKRIRDAWAIVSKVWPSDSHRRARRSLERRVRRLGLDRVY